MNYTPTDLSDTEDAELGRNLVNHKTLSPLGFSQVLIIKEVKVICFDILLQVLILKVDTGAVQSGADSTPTRRGPR